MTTATVEPQLRDITLRDGLQLTGKLLPTAKKLAFARNLLRVGVPSIEIGAMARPDRVPPMANTVEVIAGLTSDELLRCWVWAATPRSIQRAIDEGASNFEYCLSVSNEHNLANVGRSTEESLDAMPAAIEAVAAVGGRVQLTLATAFTCPFTGPIDPERVLAIANDLRTAGAVDIVICDTIGQAIPTQVSSLIARVKRETPLRQIVFHGHDTWGQGVANTLAAISAGASTVDGALGGLGGCPFAPGASGNTASEDILFALRPEWLTPSSFRSLAEWSTELLSEVGEPNRSSALRGAQLSSSAFEWSMKSRSI